MNLRAFATEINALLDAESRSLMEHAHELTPYVSAKTYRTWQAIQEFYQRDTDHAGRLTAILQAIGAPERPRPFSQAVGHYHFITIEKLLALLIEEKTRQVAAYDRAIKHAGNEEAVKTELTGLREDNISELARLQVMLQGLMVGTGGLLDPNHSPDLNNAANVVEARKALEKAKAK
ncbi:MAG: hypothetical protein WD768_21610 [Phycisphaeraceae bacterium]